jgi:O-antigen/teichoic acid export membrane protein
MIDKNFAYHALGISLSFLLTPLVVKSYGAEAFGLYSLVMTYSLLVSTFLTMRSEVAFSRKNNKIIKSKGNLYQLAVCLIITISLLFMFTVLTQSFSLLAPPKKIDGVFLWVVTVNAALLAIFSILNFILIANLSFYYSKLQFLKNIFIYAVLFCVFLCFDELDYLQMSFSFAVSLIACCLLAIVKLKRTDFFNKNEPFVFTGKDFTATLKSSTPFMLSSSASIAREALIASYIVYSFDTTAVGVYYFTVLYMVKPFQTYSSIISNRIKFAILSSAGANKSVHAHLKFSAILFLVLLSVFFVHDEIFSFFGFHKSLVVALLPISFAYIFFMPYTALYEVYAKGNVDFYFNLVHAIVVSMLCVFDYAEDLSLELFLLLMSINFFVFYFVQALLIIRHSKSGMITTPMSC